MCGIFGIINNDKLLREEALKMQATLKDRGPDNSNFIEIKNSIIGSTRLAVVDQDKNSNQPFFSNSRNTVIVFNGEIYNYKELKKKYNLKTTTNSDTEVFVELFELIGKKAFQEVEGMFAVCIYSFINKNFCLARDSLGIKPLYFSCEKQTLYFSSEIKGILDTSFYKPQIDLNTLVDFIGIGLLDHSNKTFFKNINSLEPGEFLEISHDYKLNSSKNIKYLEIAKKNLNKGGEFLCNLFGEELLKSIRLQSKTVRSIGSHLSGGIDSSLLTSLLKEERNDLKTYTFGYQESFFDERPNAKNISRELNLNNKTSLLKYEDIDSLFLKTLQVHDEPFTSLRQLSHLKIYLDFREESTVIFEASGGDEIGAGYRGFIWPNFVDNCSKLGYEESYEKLKIYAKSRNIKNLEKFFVENSLNMNIYGLCTSDGSYASGMRYLKCKNLLSERIHEYRINTSLPFDSHLRNAQYFELSKTKLPRGLRYIDRSSSSVGKEARVPLLTNKLVGIGLSIPPEYKINSEGSRLFMTKIATKKCPYLKNNTLKKDIADPQTIWMKTKFASTILKVFNSKRFQERNIFYHQQLIKDFEEFTRTDFKFHSLQFFNIFIVEIWLRFFVDCNKSERRKFKSLSEFINETEF